MKDASKKQISLEGLDLSQNGDAQHAELNSPRVLLERQIYDQRKCLFWIAILVCFFLYILFIIFVFSSHLYRVVVSHTPFANALALGLLVVPSFLLWGLIRSVYGRRNKNTEEEQSLKTLMSDLLDAIKSLKDTWPGSS